MDQQTGNAPAPPLSSDFWQGFEASVGSEVLGKLRGCVTQAALASANAHEIIIAEAKHRGLEGDDAGAFIQTALAWMNVVALPPIAQTLGDLIDSEQTEQ